MANGVRNGPTHGVHVFLRCLASAVGLCGLVVGIPVALVLCHATPPLAQCVHLLARPATVLHYLGRPMNDAVLTTSFACAAWMAWMWLSACVTAEVVASVRGLPALRLPASRHAQSLAAFLVGASLAMFPLGRYGQTMRLQVVPAAVHAVSPRVAGWGEPGGYLDGAVPRNVTDLSSGPDPAMSLTAVSVPLSGQVYVVRPGDTLWSIAEVELGSPLKWREIAELNYDKPQPGGGRLTDAHWIFPGWELTLPASEPVGDASVTTGRQVDSSGDDVGVATAASNPGAIPRREASALFPPDLAGDAAVSAVTPAVRTGDIGSASDRPGNRRSGRVRPYGRRCDRLTRSPAPCAAPP
jgi:LysM repeat protein